MPFINYVFLVVIIIAAAAYLYFKTKQFRTDYPIRKKWYKAKAGIALGSFLIAFGVNTAIMFTDSLSYIIGAIFILFGLTYLNNDIRRMRHEGRFVKEEYELNRP
jgi:amino acid transporter